MTKISDKDKKDWEMLETGKIVDIENSPKVITRHNLATPGLQN